MLPYMHTVLKLHSICMNIISLNPHNDLGRKAVIFSMLQIRKRTEFRRGMTGLDTSVLELGSNLELWSLRNAFHLLI